MNAGKVIWVVTERRGDAIAPVSLETAAFARRLADALGNTIVKAIVLGPPGSSRDNDIGLDLIAAEHETLTYYNADAWTGVLSELAQASPPAYILVPHTAVGWDYAPRLAVALGGSCVTGVIDLVAGEPMLFRRSANSGKTVQEIAPAPDGPAVITVMPGATPPVTAMSPGKTTRIALQSPELDRRATRSRTIAYKESVPAGLDLSRAEVIVTAGRGIAGPENLGLVRDLAACFDKSAVGASRPVVDAGWLPYEHQVGQTGQTVAPRLYLALGVSGAIQHTAGMASSELIVAVDSDPNAAIFNLAHLGVVTDLHEFVPALIYRLSRLRQSEDKP